MILCDKIRYFQSDFVKKLKYKLEKTKPRYVVIDKVYSMIKDSLYYLDGKDNKDSETNQAILRMKELF